MSRILTQAKSLVKNDVVILSKKGGEGRFKVKANVPHPRLEDTVLILLVGAEPLERESGELVRIQERKMPIY